MTRKNLIKQAMQRAILRKRYKNGFLKKCAQSGVNPNKLVKLAYETPEVSNWSKGLGAAGGALLGGALGALVAPGHRTAGFLLGSGLGGAAGYGYGAWQGSGVTEALKSLDDARARAEKAGLKVDKSKDLNNFGMGLTTLFSPGALKDSAKSLAAQYDEAIKKRVQDAAASAGINVNVGSGTPPAGQQTAGQQTAGQKTPPPAASAAPSGSDPNAGTDDQKYEELQQVLRDRVADAVARGQRLASPRLISYIAEQYGINPEQVAEMYNQLMAEYENQLPM